MWSDEITVNAFYTSQQEKNIRKKIVDIDGFDEGSVRRIICNFYLTKKMSPYSETDQPEVEGRQWSKRREHYC